ncbi:hypothetical protein DN730_05145 [Marinomonas piezotolerans]|uniref:Uncharacterized protein n=1 Tax=Marinomonas piezotolerans TaxID=2213058 RepID=A0A370UBD0_9GAMM|nr:hypothetical protein [Marinomonas piezotolerans]RDL45005.1 hypothetical protein DN730_05145 [Marinomonas piezotolerans]
MGQETASITAQDWASGRIDKHDGANVTHSAKPKCSLIGLSTFCFAVILVSVFPKLRLYGKETGVGFVRFDLA